MNYQRDKGEKFREYRGLVLKSKLLVARDDFTVYGGSMADCLVCNISPAPGPAHQGRGDAQPQ